jgi:hypothetical protein
MSCLLLVGGEPPRAFGALLVPRESASGTIGCPDRSLSSIAGEILDAVLADVLPLVAAVKASYDAGAAASPRSGTVGPDACL